MLPCFLAPIPTRKNDFEPRRTASCFLIVLILDGSLVYDAHVLIELGNFFWLRHLFTSKAASNLIVFYPCVRKQSWATILHKYHVFSRPFYPAGWIKNKAVKLRIRIRAFWLDPDPVFFRKLGSGLSLNEFLWYLWFT